jgi:ribosomal protein S14
MYYLKIKDQKYRKHFKKFEIKFILKKFVIKNLLAFLYYNSKISIIQKKKIYYQLLKYKKKNILNKIVRRCILTNRSKSLRFLKISRLEAKELISFGIIPGYKKAIW